MKCKNEHGGDVYVANIGRIAFKNRNFRESVWTGHYLQMTLMSIPCGDKIGTENHCDADQYIRVEHGCAMAYTGNRQDALCNRYKLSMGDSIFIPAGTWHNIVNVGRRELKISSIYAPPHHPRCTVEKYKNEY
ncbi:MAG: cupin domain-containing protein [Clostridia bacterium]|nr:cupin domain-containing protein [Clostridia bacterium]